MKAVLVIDMPTDCIKCPLADGYCWNTFPTKGRADGCPLRPLPEVRDVHCHYDDWELERIKNAESRGFNWCIDEIMGEKE